MARQNRTVQVKVERGTVRRDTDIRELLPRGEKRKTRTPEQIELAAGTGFDYPVSQVGVAGNVTVYYDPSLGKPGLSLATQLLNVVTGPYSNMETIFAIGGDAVSVVIAPLGSGNDGSGGAYHYGCDFVSPLYLDATFASPFDPLRIEAGLYVAELSECFMGKQARGWNCGFSNGEGLSRFCAQQETSLHTLWAAGPTWAQAGFPDWVTKTDTTDRNEISTGCAVIYLYFMCAMGYTIPQIVQAGGNTLACLIHQG